MAERARRRSSARRGVLLLAFCAAAAGGAEIRHLEIEKQDKRYRVTSETFVAAPTDAVYDMLTDYDHFDRVSSVFEESRFLERNADGSGIVYTKAHGCVLFFCQTIERTERLDVVPGSEIVATVIPERSTTPYGVARWRLLPENDGTVIHYELEMEPDFWVPPLIGPLIMKRTLAKAGERVAERIEYYASQAADADSQVAGASASAARP